MRLTTLATIPLWCSMASTAMAAPARLWALDESARVDPQSAVVIEGRGGLFFRGGESSDVVSLVGARNETVAFQVIVDFQRAPDNQRPGVVQEVALTQLTGPGRLRQGREIRLFRQWYVHLAAPSSHEEAGAQSSWLETWFPRVGSPLRLVTSLGPGWYPDPLVPLDGPSAEGLPGLPLRVPSTDNPVPGQRAQGFWLDIWIPATAEPGTYRGEVRAVIGPDDGAVRLPVELTVLPVTLPDEFHAGVGSVSYDFVGIHLAQRGPEAVHDFFRMVHAHRLTVDALYLHPHWQDGQIDWQDYDAIVAPLLDGTAFAPDGSGGYVGPGANQPVRRFVLPVDWNWPVPPSHSEYEDSFTRALVEVERHILERGWTRTQWSLFINSTDEPRRLEDFEALRRYGRLLRQAPLRQADLFRHRIDAGPFKSIGRQLPGWDLDRIFREVGEVIDIWNSCAGVPYVPAAAMAQRLAQQPHEEAWFYFSNTAGEPAVGSLLIDGEALGPRTWGWILWRYGFAAGVSWEIGWPSPSCLSNSRCSGFGLHGDASLVYLADALGVPGRVLPSIRLKNLRRGAEDYEYLWLLRQAGQGQLAEAYAYSLVPRALDDRLVENMAGAWHHDPSAWERVRREMGLVLAGQQDPPSIEAVRAGAVPVVLTTPIFSRRASVLAAVFLLLLVVTFVLWPDRRRRRRR